MHARSFLILFLNLAASATLAADEAPGRSALESFAAGLETYQATFTQIVRAQDGRLQDQVTGQVWLQTPDKLRWVYQGEFPETIVADGEKIWIHDVTLQQVTVKPQSDQAADSPLLILADISLLDEQFSVTELGDFDGMALLELRSLGAETEFERVLLGFDEAGISMMAMEDAFGQRTEVRFTEASRNQPLEPGLFHFEAPADADVVGMSSDLD